MRRPFRSALPALLLLAACPAATVAPTPDAPAAPTSASPTTVTPATRTSADETPALRSLRSSVLTLVRTQTLAYWDAWTTGASIDPATPATARLALASPDTARLLADARTALDADADATPERRRALELLQRFVDGERVGQGLATIDAGASAALQRARVKVGEQELALADVEAQLAAEPSATERAALEAAAVAALPPLVAFEKTRRERLATLVDADGLARWHDTTATAARTLAERTLAATEASHRRRLDAVARTETGLPPEKLRRADLPRLLRPPRLAQGFGGKAALDAARSTFRSLGLELDGRPGLTLDTTPSPKRQPRPAAFLVEVPGDVRLSYKPGAGEDHQRALLHELAVALAATFTRAEPAELRTLGTAPAALAGAYLFEELVADPEWLTTVAGLAAVDASRIAEHARFRRLAVVRRLAAAVQYTIDSADYASLATRATGVPWTEAEGARWVLETDGLLGELDHLRAHLLAAQFANHLRTTHGRRWWTVPAAGAWLAEQWKHGAARTFESESAALDPAALVADVDR